MVRASFRRGLSLCCLALLSCAAVGLAAPPAQSRAGAAPAEPGGRGPDDGEARAGLAALDALDHVDPTLQAGLEEIVRSLELGSLAAEGRLGIALVDLTGSPEGRFAAVNGDRMIYAASLPKIAILLGAFDAVERGALRLTAGLRDRLTRMIRVSDNAAATGVLEQVGFRSLARTLQRPPVRLYDASAGGGLWVGKAYGRDRYWRRDPVAELSHGATARQVARFFVMLEHGELVSPEASAEMKELLGEPGIHHKFVRGLDARPGATIYRKSGTWRDFHADAALVERPEATYVAVGLVHDSRGGQILERLIVAFDDLVRRQHATPGTR